MTAGAGRAAALALAALLVGTSVAQAALLAGILRDPPGDPLAGVVWLHAAGRGAAAGPEGAFRLAPPETADVLVAAAPGHIPRLVAVNASVPQVLNLTLHPVDPAPTVLLAGGAQDELVVGLQRLTEASPPAGELVFPLEVPPGALTVAVNVSWSDAPTILRADLVHEATGARMGDIYDAGRLSFLAPPGLVRDHPGAYRLHIRPSQPVAGALTVDAQWVITTGPFRSKVVEGRAPEVVDGLGEDSGAFHESMDIAAVTFTNETEHQVDLVLTLANLGSVRPSPGQRYAFWTVLWSLAGVRYFASFKGEPEAPAALEVRPFTVGTCSPSGECVVANGRLVPGELRLGAMGSIVWHVPKDVAGRPPDGAVLEAPRAYTFHSAQDRSFFEAVQDAELRGVAFDETPEGRPYVVGAAEFALPEEAFALLGAPESFLPAGGSGGAAPGESAAQGGSGPPAPLAPAWFLAPLLLAGLGLLVAAAVLRRSRRAARPRSKYDKIRLLGEGANGRTFLARHRELGRLVALKEMLPSFSADGTARAMFVREARIGGELRHPHVVDIYDIEDGPEGVRMVMEYCEGGSLQERVDQGALPRDEALRLWRETLEGLTAIHAAGVVHRDIKPSNILLTRDGRAKVADFGVARSSREHTIAGTGSQSSPVGTPLYMSPEQLRGAAPTASSDVYAATAVAYRLLTGRPHVRIEGHTPWAVLAARAAQSPVLPVPELPAELNALLAAGLAEDPRQRPPSAGEMLAALDQYLQRSPSRGARRRSPRPSGEPGAATLR